MGYSGPVRLARRIAWTLLAAAALAAPAAGAPVAGWRRIDLPESGAYFWRYLPASWSAAAPAPVVLFFHGAGADPSLYRELLQEAAEAAGCVLLLPKSQALGWGTAVDAARVAESLALTRAELLVDAARVAVAGHSAGGAYAYLLAHTTVGRYSAVFTLAAPFYPVDSVADPAHKAPVRMLYGSLDPNYTGGAADRLAAQWRMLGVAHELEVASGYDHGSWPPSSIAAGLRFLVAARYPGYSSTCSPTASSYCLEDGRYRVAVSFHDFAGAAGTGATVPGSSWSSGLFWFFAPDNWELLVKVLDGCAVNGHVWVFASAATTVERELLVTDTQTGVERRYPTPAGHPAALLADTAAFPCAPP